MLNTKDLLAALALTIAALLFAPLTVQDADASCVNASVRKDCE